MATRDFDNVPQEDPNVSDIESEKDVFNDETFGVDIDDLEGNEFDFASTTAATAAQPTYPNQNLVTKHGHVFNHGGDESGDSDDLNGSAQRQQPHPQQQWNKPLSQRNEAYQARPMDQYAKGQVPYDRGFDQSGQNRVSPSLLRVSSANTCMNCQGSIQPPGARRV